ncbi:MAG: hypothetical protein WDW38_005236 [Sanguina aurantia]
MRTTILPGRVSHGVPEAHPTVRPKLQSAGMRGRNAVLCQAATIQRGVTSSPPSFILPPKGGARGGSSIDYDDIGRDSCNVSSRYSPEYVQGRVLNKPEDALRMVGRALSITGRLGWFFASLKADELLGRADTSAFVKLRAAQIRIMEADLGRPIEEVFASISERPIAAASLGQVYKAVLRDTGEEVAVKLQRPGVEPTIRVITDTGRHPGARLEAESRGAVDGEPVRAVATLFDTLAQQRLGCAAQLIVDEFGEKIMEELDYRQEARNIEDFNRNFKNDPTVKIPWVRKDLCGSQVLVMEWIDGIRCTDPEAIQKSGINVEQFIKCGVVSGLRQLLEIGMFHGDPHPGNIFCMRDGRIAYVDFGNVSELSQRSKEVLIDAVVHAVNEDYENMAGDFIKLGFLAPGTNISPIVPALEKIWTDSKGQSLADFNFRTVTSKFNELVYQYPIRIPERYSLVIRSLLTQEGICMTLKPEFHFLEVAYPYIARRLLTDEDPALRGRLFQVLFSDGKFQWKRLENLISLAREGGGGKSGAGLDLSDTVKDALRIVLLDNKLRTQVIMALTEDNKLHVEEVLGLLKLVQDDIDPQKLAGDVISSVPSLGRQLLLNWADRVLVS